MNYFLVKCKFGHVGRNKYLPLLIPVIAENAKEASSQAKKIGGVKKDHKDWCLEYPKQVEFNEYQKAYIDFRNDIYFEKKSRSRIELFTGRLVDEPNYSNINGIKTNKPIIYHKRNRDVIEYKKKREQEYLSTISPYRLRILNSTSKPKGVA
ncbi:MAG: hypothetical protein AB7U79_02420 [Candidatus Izemoplasmatales bacterium]